MKNVLVYPSGVCRSSRNPCALWTSVICQLSQSPALNGWESRAGISNPVPWMFRGGKCWLWSIWEWNGGPGTLLLSGNCFLCLWPILAAPTFPCQVLDVHEENGKLLLPRENRKVSEIKQELNSPLSFNSGCFISLFYFLLIFFPSWNYLLIHKKFWNCTF